MQLLVLAVLISSACAQIAQSNYYSNTPYYGTPKVNHQQAVPIQSQPVQVSNGHKSQTVEYVQQNNPSYPRNNPHFPYPSNVVDTVMERQSAPDQPKMRPHFAPKHIPGPNGLSLPYDQVKLACVDVCVQSGGCQYYYNQVPVAFGTTTLETARSACADNAANCNRCLDNCNVIPYNLSEDDKQRKTLELIAIRCDGCNYENIRARCAFTAAATWSMEHTPATTPACGAEINCVTDTIAQDARCKFTNNINNRFPITNLPTTITAQIIFNEQLIEARRQLCRPHYVPIVPVAVKRPVVQPVKPIVSAPHNPYYGTQTHQYAPQAQQAYRKPYPAGRK